MLTINPISLLEIQGIKKQNSYHYVPWFSQRYNKNLSVDIVSFQGQTVDKDEAKRLIEKYKKRAGIGHEFSQRDIEVLVNSVTPKNEEFLEDFLTLQSKKLGSASIKKLLDYADKSDTDVDIFKKRIERFNNLKNIFQGEDCSQNDLLINSLCEMSPNVIVEFLTTDVLTPKSMQKNKFNLLTTAYNYLSDIYIPKQIKRKDAERKYRNMPPMTDQDRQEFVKNFIKGSKENPNLAHVLIFRMIFDESTCNYLLDNKSKYVPSIYYPRYKMLNDDDKRLLLEICSSGITDKHNKGGNLSPYDISADDKINTMNILSSNREIINAGYEGINIMDYIRPANNISGLYGNIYVDYQSMKIDLMDKALRRIGIENSVVDKYMKEFNQAYKKDPTLAEYRDKFWDINYAHLINYKPNDPPILPLILQDVIIASTNGRFGDFLFKDGEIADRNNKNKEIFEKNGINYDKWLHPTTKPLERVFISKSSKKDKDKKIFTASIWRRIPQESLFDGNYATCCAGVDKDQGLSFQHYLANTATNIIEVRSEKGKIIGMSGLMFAKVNGKLSLIVDSIEVNNRMVRKYLYDDKQRYRYREMIFDYARKFAQEINNTGEELPIYFSGKYFKVKDIEKGLGESRRLDDIELIGEYPNKIYINAYGGNYDKERMAYADDGDGFAMTLIDITKQRPPIIDENNNVISDTNYNFDDIVDYNH